jgi:isopenicillin N synthase-like dioxygenase
MAEVAPLTEIPVVSLADFEAGGVRRDAFTDLVRRALHDIGFMYVRTPDDVLEALPPMYEACERLFDLPEEVKRSYDQGVETGRQRGYTPLDAEQGMFCKNIGPGGQAVPNHAENWFVGPDLAADSPLLNGSSTNQVNIWPNEVPELKDRIDPVYYGLYRMGRLMLASLEVSLDKDPGYFDAMVEGSPTLFRPLHYPAVDEADERETRIIGACTHTDINLLTVLPAPTRAGLYVKTRQGVWTPGNSAPPGHLIIQVGDMLQHMTGGYYLSAEHKVTALVAQSADDPGRYSSALFIHPASHQPLEVIESLTDHPEDYPTIATGAFLQQRLREIGLLDGELLGS